jgi:hypothetical protein
VTLSVVGGTYWESCIEPEWQELYGSGFRAASLLAEPQRRVLFTTRISAEDERHLRTHAAARNIELRATVDVRPTMRFRYACPLDDPFIWPPADGVARAGLSTVADIVLAFGMLDARPSLRARIAIWDPQSAFPTMPPGADACERFAIVANAQQIRALAAVDDLDEAVAVLASRGAVVVAKLGLRGARIREGASVTSVPAFRSEGAFTIGSGDVFSAIFARCWAIEGLGAAQAAEVASRAVSRYAATKSLEGLDTERLHGAPAEPLAPRTGSAYLAAPFFDLGQLMLLRLAEQSLAEVGLRVLSPLREIGWGDPAVVAPADLALMSRADVVFAVLADRDPGTLFELGYARDRGIPVVAYAPNLPKHHRTMLLGSGVQLFDDFASAVVAAATS